MVRLDFSRNRLGNLLQGVTNRESFSPFTTPGGQNGATGGGAHAVTKTVLVDSLAIMRLVGALHG